VPEHHQRLTGEIGDPQRCGRRGRGRRGDHDQVLPHQLDRAERGRRGRQRQHHERQVERAARQFPYEVVRAGLLDEDLDAGVQIVEGAQHLRQQTGAQARRRPEPHPAAAQLGHLLHLAAGRVGVGEDAAGEREQRLPGVGEGDVAPRAAEEIRAQLLLQRPDLLGEGRLGDMDPLRGPGEVQGLGDRGEVAELLQLHDASLAAQ
jgi:hypothetical protein